VPTRWATRPAQPSRSRSPPRCRTSDPSHGAGSAPSGASGSSWEVDAGDQLLRWQHAEAVGRELAALVALGGVVDGESDRVATPPQHPERWSGVTQHFELVAFGAEH